MSTKTIRKGKHRAWPPSIGIFFKRESVSKRICFTSSCKYELDNENREDWNKLFGIGYNESLLSFIITPFRWLISKIKKKPFTPPHNIDSARIGWRHNWITDNVSVCAYCYVRGTRIEWLLCEMKYDKDYIVSLVVTGDRYHFIITEADCNVSISRDTVRKFHHKKWGYPLGVYFGGNKVAPQTMKIKIENA
jgi:hypothetical protein